MQNVNLNLVKYTDKQEQNTAGYCSCVDWPSALLLANRLSKWNPFFLLAQECSLLNTLQTYRQCSLLNTLQTDRQTDRQCSLLNTLQADRQTVLTAEHTAGRQTDRQCSLLNTLQTDRQTDRQCSLLNTLQTDRQTDRQIQFTVKRRSVFNSMYCVQHDDMDSSLPS